MKRRGQQVPREESGARDSVFIVVVGEWWAPRSFLEIFAFLDVLEAAETRGQTKVKAGA